MSNRHRNALEPAASQAAGTPRSEIVLTAGSSASPSGVTTSRAARGRFDSVPGGRGEARLASEGRQPLCGGSGAEPSPGSARREAGVADAASSSLDNSRITQDGTTVGPRNRWLSRVESATDAHRIAKAQHHWRRAAEIRRERLQQQRPWDEIVGGARWHQRRAWGQIDRFAHVQDCGAKKYWLLCSECHGVQERTASCRVPLLCLTCRGTITRERRAEFHFARNRALDRAHGRDLFDFSRPGGRWTEKLLTLTSPHCPEHGVVQRIASLFAAWPLLRDSIKKHFAKTAAPHEDLVTWFRTFEWEPGNDGQGHPHFHLWWLSPFIDHKLIRHWWRCALQTAGFSAPSLAHVIIDIREIRNGRGAALEVIKYLTKDILPDRQLVRPEVFARVYEALDGRRLTQASARFFKCVERQAKCNCGAVGCFQRTTIPPATKTGGAHNG